jgi:hypothetical protein
MPSLFGMFKGKEAQKRGTKGQNGAAIEPSKPRWTDAWTRTEVEPEEIAELVHGATAELKSRGESPSPSASRLLRILAREAVYDIGHGSQSSCASRFGGHTTGTDNLFIEKRLKCPSCSFLSGLHRTQAQRGPLSAISSVRVLWKRLQWAERDWRLSCGWSSHWYAVIVCRVLCPPVNTTCLGSC